MIGGDDLETVNESMIDHDRVEKPQLTLMELAFLFAFALGNGSLIGSYFLITLPMEAKRMDKERAAMYLGGFVCIAGITQLICPVVGLYSDRCNHKMGKRRPFLLYGGIAGVAGLYLQLIARSYDMWFLYSIAFTISMLALNTIYSSMNGLIPDHVAEAQTGKANGVIAMLTVIGAISSFAVFHFVVHGLEGFYMFYMILVASTVGISVTMAGQLESREAPMDKPNFPSVTIKDIRMAFYISPVIHRDFFLILVSRTLYYMGISSQTFLMYYVRDQLHMTDEEAEQYTAILAVVGQCCGVLTALPVGMISDSSNTGRKKYIYFACAVMAIGNISFVMATAKSSVLIITCFIGAANGIYLTMDGSLAIDALPSKAEAARFLGIWGVGAFIGTALGPLIGGPMLMFNTNVDGSYSIYGYMLLLCGSAVYLTLSAAVLQKTTVN